MDPNRTTLERAFELAQSGQCADVASIVSILRREGYGTSQIVGRSLHSQLRGIIREARDKTAE